MPLKSPNLDDRKYEDLLAEARKLIPAFNPEWTDHNDGDPGITMLQLFSWLGDQIIYRLNRVPDKNYVEFLRLAGVRLRAAAPARTMLTFKLTDGASPTWIPKGTQVDADTGGEEPLTFETLVDLQAAEAQMTAVAVGSEGGLQLLAQPTEPMPVGTAPDGVSFDPFGATVVDEAALYLGFNRAVPRGLEFRLRFLVPESSGSSGRAPDWVGPPRPATKAPGQITWEWFGADGWHVLDQVLDTTAGLLAEGEVRFKVPGQMAADDLDLTELAEAEDGPPFWLRGRVTAPQYETAPRLRAVLWNAVPAAHAATMSEETLGRANGEPNQAYTLAYQPVLAGSLKLQAEENGDMVDWTEVPDLLASGPADRHYTLESATGVINGGDGVNGRIWPLNAAVVAVTYARGGGKAGNVAAN
ncbi:MAG: putative baseplate assembly protein, partial [Bacillota bacterium]